MYAKIKMFKAKSDCIKESVYIDLGKTGTSFKREGFERMMQDVRCGKVNCIVVKDLSRFGRNYIETGNYIEKVFPLLGVRFIAVTDHFDSMQDSVSAKGMMSAELKNLVNEMYAKDIALKVRSAKRAKWEQGSFTGGVPPYGYRLEDTDGRKRLCPEKNTSDIIRHMFDLFLSGKNMVQIKVWLYEQKVHRPKDYRKCGHIYAEDGEIVKEWSKGTIKSILSNPVYTGCLVQGIGGGKNAAGRKQHQIQKEDWSVKEHTHEALIDADRFMQAARRFEKASVYSNRKGFSKTVPHKEDIFENMLYCKECGAKMSRTCTIKKLGSKDNVRYYHYYCRNAERMDVFRCKEKYISLETLAGLVKTALYEQISLAASGQEAFVQAAVHMIGQKASGKKKQYENCLYCIGRKEENIKKRLSEQYAKYRLGMISQEKFQKAKRVQEAETVSLEKQKAKIEQSAAALEQKEHNCRQLIQQLCSCSEKTELTKEIVSAFIHRIEICPDHMIKIIFAFCSV